jgi:phytoene dehydrogenase-like protein
MPAESPKTIIVGGGIAGLVAAATLARAGVSVTLLESAADLGGRARTRHADGYSLNQGPHALYRGAFLRTLKQLGIAVAGAPARFNPPRSIRRGRLHRLPDTAASLWSTSLFGLRDKLQFARTLREVVSDATAAGSYADWLKARRLRPAVQQAVEALARVSTYANAPALMSATAESIDRPFEPLPKLVAQHPLPNCLLG